MAGEPLVWAAQDNGWADAGVAAIIAVARLWGGAARLALHKAAVVDPTTCNHRRRDRWVRWGLHQPWWLCEEEMAIWLNKKRYIVVRS